MLEIIRADGTAEKIKIDKIANYILEKRKCQSF